MVFISSSDLELSCEASSRSVGDSGLELIYVLSVRRLEKNTCQTFRSFPKSFLAILTPNLTWIRFSMLLQTNLGGEIGSGRLQL
jgi:hypothetical protein